MSSFHSTHTHPYTPVAATAPQSPLSSSSSSTAAASTTAQRPRRQSTLSLPSALPSSSSSASTSAVYRPDVLKPQKLQQRFAQAEEEKQSYDEGEIADEASSPLEEESKVDPFAVTLKLIDDLDEAHRYDDSLAQLQKAINMWPNQAELYWRLCRGRYHAAKRHTDEQDMQKDMVLSMEAGEKAVALAPSAPAHKWYALALSEVGNFAGTKIKIANGHKFRAQTLLALALDPSDADLHHMLGRFCFEVASISWTVKKVAAATVGALPETSYEEALGHFNKAQELQGDWILNLVYKAKALHKVGRKTEAKELAQKALSLPSKNREDEGAVAKAQQLITQL